MSGTGCSALTTYFTTSSVKQTSRTTNQNQIEVRTFTVDGLNGEAAAGTYTLRVADIAGGDEGTVNSWSVEILTE